jgi:hypothetical protein
MLELSLSSTLLPVFNLSFLICSFFEIFYLRFGIYLVFVSWPLIFYFYLENTKYPSLLLPRPLGERIKVRDFLLLAFSNLLFV